MTRHRFAWAHLLLVIVLAIIGTACSSDGSAEASRDAGSDNEASDGLAECVDAFNTDPTNGMRQGFEEWESPRTSYVFVMKKPSEVRCGFVIYFDHNGMAYRTEYVDGDWRTLDGGHSSSPPDLDWNAEYDGDGSIELT